MTQRTTLRELFGEGVDAVQVVEHLCLPGPLCAIATTRRRRLYLRGAHAISRRSAAGSHDPQC